MNSDFTYYESVENSCCNYTLFLKLETKNAEIIGNSTKNSTTIERKIYENDTKINIYTKIRSPLNGSFKYS